MSSARAITPLAGGKKHAIESKRSCNRSALEARSARQLAKKIVSKLENAGVPSGNISRERASERECEREDDSSSSAQQQDNLSILQTECTVVWSNAAFRSETGPNSSSSSSGERLLQLECLSSTGKNFSTVSDSLAENPPGNVARSSRCLGSTRKVLARDPAFREACSSATPTILEDSLRERDFEEGWVHGPDRDIESELSATIIQAKLEDESDRKMEEELQHGIVALSRKLADLQSKRTTKAAGQRDLPSKQSSLSDPSCGAKSRQNIRNKKKQVMEEARARISQPIREKPRECSTNTKTFENLRCEAQKKNTAKPKQQRSVRGAGTEQSCDPSLLEDQLKSLRLSPRFWGKTFDWAKSLRATKPPDRTAAPRKEGRTVLGERKRHEKEKVDPKTNAAKADTNEKRRNLSQTGKNLSLAGAQPRKTLAKAGKSLKPGLKVATWKEEEESFPVFTAKFRD